MHRERGDIAAFAAAEEVVRLGEQLEFFEWSTAGRMQIALLSWPKRRRRGTGRAELAPSPRSGSEASEWTVRRLQLEQGWGYVVLGDIDGRRRACTTPRR